MRTRFTPACKSDSNFQDLHEFGDGGAEWALLLHQTAGAPAGKPESNLFGRATLPRVQYCLVKLRVLILAAGLALVCSGCNRDDEQIKVYRLVKAPLESSPSETDSSSLADNPSAPVPPMEGSQALAPSAALPSNWEPQPLSQMRKASFLVRGEKGAVADISLVVLGAAAGNVLENVNRWLSQLGQAPVSAEKLASFVQHLPTARGDVVVVDLEGTPENGDASKDGRIVAGMVSDEGQTSFFKMRGNAALVETEKDNFLKWVSTVCGAGSPIEAMNSGAPPSAPNPPQIKWDLPEGWASAPASAMRYASFTAAGENGQTADISIVTFPGDGGGDLENVNRWRKQIGLPPTESSKLSSLVVSLPGGGGPYSTVDMAGTNSRVVAGWTRRDGRTWFFKLTGPSAIVEKEKPSFTKFLQSVRF